MATDPRRSSTLAWRVLLAAVLLSLAGSGALAALAWLAAGTPDPAQPWQTWAPLAGANLAARWPIALGLVAVLAVVAWLLARWAVRPVRRLAQTLAGDPVDAQRLPAHARDETGQIACAYQAQAEALRRASQALEQHARASAAQLARLEALLRLGEELNHAPDSERLLRLAAGALLAQFPCERAEACLIDGAALVCYPGERRARDGYDPPIRERLDAQALAALAAGEGVCRLDDLATAERPPFVPAAPGMRAALAAVVVSGGQPVALLRLWSGHPAAFGPADERPARIVAGQLGAALGSLARLRGEQSRRRLAEAIARVAQTLDNALPLDGMHATILNQLAQALPHDRSALLRLEGDRLEIAAVRGMDGPPPRARLPLAEAPLLAALAAEERPAAVSDTAAEPRYRPLLGRPAGSWLGAPLLRHGRVTGALVLECDTAGRFGPDDLPAVGAIAAQAAVVLENARLSAAAEELTRQLEVVTNVTQLVNSRDVSRELPGLLRTIIHQIRLVVPCDLAAVALANDGADSFTVETVYDYAVRDPTELPPAAQVPAEGTPWQTACRTGSPLVQRDLAASGFAEDRDLAARGLSAGVVVPISGGNRTMGALRFACRQPEVYREPQVATLLEIARQVGTMLHKERLAREREEAASELARSREHLNMVDKVRLVGQLASGVAHDFNNLLAGILGNAQLLLLEIEDAEQREMLRVIERAAKDGTETVRRLQGFARMQPDEQMTDVWLDALARDAIDLTRPRWRDVAQRRGARIEIKREIAPTPAILGRPGELREVLSNLIINAADAIPRSGVITVCTAEETDADGGRWVVATVADTGTGIPPEVQARIFDPFFTTKGEQGTGLGLAVSLGIVQSHGGRIDVASEPGVGTRFSVRLPVRAAGQPPVATPAPRRNLPMRPGHVLLAESELMLRAPTARLLRRWGHRVTEAADGAAALAAFAPGEFDLVISDLGMPDMSGFDLLAEIRRRDPAVPTVLLSGWGRADPDDGRETVADAVLEKPFDQDELRAVVAGVLARR